MDKEIIIDGVNVAGCGYFCESDNECSICGMGTDGEDTFCRYCKDNSNCYYKQLQQLKAENERLKEELDKYNVQPPACVVDTVYQGAIISNEIYKQALQEIKVIVENIINNDDKPVCVNDKECPLNGGEGYDNHCNMECPFILGKQILQKISEVE